MAVVHTHPSFLRCAFLCLPIILLFHLFASRTAAWSPSPQPTRSLPSLSSNGSTMSYSPKRLSTLNLSKQNSEDDVYTESLIKSLATPFDRTSDSLHGTLPVGLSLLILLPLLLFGTFSWDTAHAVVATTTPALSLDWSVIFEKAAKKALGGGTAGASAAVVQVSTLMWLRTCMNYQYRYGGTLTSSLQTLWQQGGIPRLYQGLPFAIIQGPLTRFGDTAANIGVLALLEALPATHDWPLPAKTLCGSLTAGLWRIFLMPLDASKTALQVQGSGGLSALWSQATEQGPGVLYRGAFAQAAATAVGHFPWFLTYNFFNDVLPIPTADAGLLPSLARSAALGFFASTVSDCCSNSLRVIKTTKQTAQLSRDDNQGDVSYPEVIRMIVDQDGLVGLFGRGLQTRLLTNAIQGAMFSVLWKYFQQSNGV